MTLEQVDGAHLIGFELNGDTFTTSISDSITAQKTYHYLKPVAEYRSIDQPNADYILSWRPRPQVYPRIREWREDGFRVPEDVTISAPSLSLLAELNGVELDTGEGTVTEIATPPFDAESARRVKQELICQHDIITTSGEGTQPLRLDEDATDDLHQLPKYP